MMNANLDIYIKSVVDLKMHAWWSFVNVFPNKRKHVSAVLAVLMGVQPKELQCNLNSNKCKLCGDYESSEHTLFECPNSHKRHELWNRVNIVMPIALKEECQGSIRTELILSCLKNTYIKEWDEVYHRILDFVYGMFQERFENYSRIELE